MPEFDPMPDDPDARTRPHRVDEPELDAGDGGGRRAGGGAAAIAVAFLIVAAIGAVAWWKLRPGAARPAVPPPAAAAPEPEPEATPAASAADAAPPLPPLDASDAYVRDLGAGLSRDTTFVSWLGHDDLVRRFVAAVANVAEGASPAVHVPFLRPAETFRVLARGDRTVVDPATFRRHDPAVTALTSLDAAACARALARLEPLFDVAWRELGDPRQDFRGTLAAALARLTSVPVPEGEVEVVPEGAVWAFADPELERRAAVEKLLLRLGPDNARRLQGWLRELAAARAAGSR